MRLVIQRVSSASVSTIEKGIVGAIGKGLCVLIGITSGDSIREIDWAVQNLTTIKFWPDSSNPGNHIHEC